MRVVDVVAGTVGEHGVDEVRLDLGRQRVERRVATRVVGRRLVLEVPTHLGLGSARARELVEVRVDEQRRRRNVVGLVGPAMPDAEFGFDAQCLRNRHVILRARSLMDG